MTPTQIDAIKQILDIMKENNIEIYASHETETEYNQWAELCIRIGENEYTYDTDSITHVTPNASACIEWLCRYGR